MMKISSRKINLIKKHCSIDGYTFVAILDYIDKYMDITKMTAKQIAEIIEVCKAQNEMGFNQCGKEFALW